MLNFCLPGIGALLLPSLACLAQKLLKKHEALLFAYCKGNGQDGLHLATSPDGLQWTALYQDKSFLMPTVSKDKLMRYPYLIRGHDGRFHLVWTTSWHQRGIGYAASKDLIHWGKQQAISVMTQEATAKNCWAPGMRYGTVLHTTKQELAQLPQ